MGRLRGMPQFGTWSVPQCRMVIEYDLELLETVRYEGYRAQPRRDAQVGGLLFGTFDGVQLRILHRRPFQLSGHGMDGFAEQLRAYKGEEMPDGQMVVGWYHLSKRPGVELPPEEVDFHERHFPSPWQVALLLRTEPNGVIHSRFFLRDSQPAPAPAASRHEEHPAAVFESGPAPIPARPYIPPRRVRSTAAALIAAVLALAAATIFYVRSNYAGPVKKSEVVRLDVAAHDGKLELAWDPLRMAGVPEANLKIRDGIHDRTVALSSTMLAAGRFDYLPGSDVTGFHLSARRSDGTAVEGSTTYILPKRSDVPAAVTDAPPAPADSTAGPAPGEALSEAAREKPKATESVDAVPAAIEKPRMELAGQWLLLSRSHSRSPAVPESLMVNMTNNGGIVSGALDARYRSETQTDQIHFTFSGRAPEKSSARYIWTGNGGQHGQIRLSASRKAPNLLQVTWSRAGSAQVFRETLTHVK